MLKKALLVYDSKFDLSRLDSFGGTTGNNNIEVVYIISLLSDGDFDNEVCGWFRNHSINSEILPFSKVFNDKSLAVRDRYMDLTGRVPHLTKKNGTLADYFRYPQSWFSSWWFTLIADKNPFKSDSFRWFITIKALLDEVKRLSINSVHAFIGDLIAMKSLEAELKYCNLEHKCASQNGSSSRKSHFHLFMTSFFCSFQFFLYLRRKMKIRKERLKKLSDVRIVFSTYFPNINAEALKQRCFISNYITPLQRAADKRYGDRVATVAIGVDIGGMTKYQSVDAANDLNENGANIIFMEEAASISDYCQAIIASLVYRFKLWLSKKAIEQWLNREGEPCLLSLWMRDLKMSYATGGVMEGYLYYRAFRKIFSHITSPCNVVYVAEMHGWERSLNAAARLHPKILTAGLQHAAIALLQLNFFEHPRLISWSAGTMDPLLPDCFGCAGKVTYDIMNQSGWPKKRLFVLGSLRVFIPKRDEMDKFSREKTYGKSVFTVALSISVEESCDILNLVLSSVKFLPKAKVYIKLHPAISLTELHSSVPALAGFRESGLVDISDESIDNLLGISDAMIVASSSTCFNALGRGKHIIVPLLSRAVCLNPLYGLSDYPVYVESMRKMLDAMKACAERRLQESVESDLFREYFEAHDDENEYLNRLQGAMARVSEITPTLNLNG